MAQETETPPRDEAGSADGVPFDQPRLTRRRLMRLLHHPGLRNIWLAQVVSQLGDGMFTVAVALAVLERTNSGTALSLTVIAQFLPFILLGIVAGALVDRWERRTTMIVSDLFRGCAVCALPVL